MKSIGLLDEAQLRNDFKRLYKDIGIDGMLQVIYELCISAQICAEVMKEEYVAETDNGD